MPRKRWRPGCRRGRSPVADYPTVLLSGSWLTQEQTSAASEFARFMHKPDQLAELAEAGFRVNGVKPPSSPVDRLPGAAVHAVGGRRRDPRHPGRSDGRPVERSGRHHHARPVDADAGRRKDPTGERDRRARGPDQSAAAHHGDGAVDVRRARGPLGGDGRAAGRPGQRAATPGGADSRAGQAVFVARRRGLVHHTAVGLPGHADQLPCGPDEFDIW